MKYAIVFWATLVGLTVVLGRAQTPPLKLLPVPDGFLPLTPRNHSEAEIRKLLKDGPRIRVKSAQSNRLSLELRYGADWNLNAGPPGMRATDEGGLLEVQVDSVLLRNGTPVPVKKPYGRAQYYLGEEGVFRETREFVLDSSIPRGELGKVTGTITVSLPVGMQVRELLASDGDPNRLITTPLVDGLDAAPNWNGRSVSISFAQGSRRKIIHIQGFDSGGLELKLVSVGGMTRADHPNAGLHGYVFEDSGRPLTRAKIFAAPRFVDRVFPFELTQPGPQPAVLAEARTLITSAKAQAPDSPPTKVEAAPPSVKKAEAEAPPAKEPVFTKDHLAEIAVLSAEKVDVGELRKGASRLSGNSAKFTWIAKELVGRDFLRVRWKATPEYKIIVTKPGYLFVIRGSEEILSPTGLTWTETQKWVMGPYISGIYRTPVKEGQKLELSGRELSLVADTIHLQVPE